MTRSLEFWFEFASTYSYPAAMEVEGACRDAGVTLQWRPFLLGPIFAAQGLTASPFMIYPTKGAYMWRDMERICEAAGLGFVKSPAFPRGSLLAARIACHYATADWVGAFVRAVYVANFANDRDIGDAGVITGILQEIGQDAAQIIEAATTADAKDALKSQTQTAGAKGIFGAPSYTVGDELFWGQDRLQQALDWARR